MLSAAQYFRPAEGLDFVPEYVAAAQNVLNKTRQTNTQIFEADALTFEGYDQYDVIYFYRPLRDTEKMHQLEERIVTSARPDALLVAAYDFFDDRYAELGCGLVDGQVYLAQGTADAGAALRRKAEHIGLVLPQFGPDQVSIWSPIEQSLRSNAIV